MSITTHSVSGSRYRVKGDITVETGTTLTLEPCVTLSLIALSGDRGMPGLVTMII